MRGISLGSLVLLLSSCSIYNSGFDCPPKKGIGCKSVSEIEAMIVEKESGPDLFLGEERSSSCNFCTKQKSSGKAARPKGAHRRVWIADRATPSGNRSGEHYLYFMDGSFDLWGSIAEETVE